MRKGSSKVASALQSKLEVKIDSIIADIASLESDLKTYNARRQALEETLAMLKEEDVTDSDESEQAA